MRYYYKKSAFAMFYSFCNADYYKYDCLYVTFKVENFFFHRTGHDEMNFYDAHNFCAYPRFDESKAFMDFHQNLFEIPKLRKFYSDTDPRCALNHENGNNNIYHIPITY